MSNPMANGSLLLLNSAEIVSFLLRSSEEEMTARILDHCKRAELNALKFKFKQDVDLKQAKITNSACAHISMAAEIFRFMKVGIHYAEQIEIKDAIPYLLLAIDPY
jgi:hypothetical protein